MKRFGEKLRILRERNSITQRQLAEQLGFTNAYVSYLESGRKKPNVELVLKIADIFQVTTDELVRDELEV